MRVAMRREKDIRVIVIWIMIPTLLAFVLFFLDGYLKLTSVLNYILAFLLTCIYAAITYYFYAWVAKKIRQRYSALNEIFKRITLMLLFCYVANTCQVYIIYYLKRYYGLFPTANLIDNPKTLDFYMCVFSTIVTVLNEAAIDWRDWKKSVAETEKLKSTYQRTKLIGLKAQMSPHFLFNCFNTLSSLIHDNEAEAEKFLDEMTKVHRYMLRNDEESMVTLKEELKAATSYLHLIKVRYGTSIEIFIDPGSDKEIRYIPLLTIQTIIENIIYSNVISKTEPLRIIIENDIESLYITSNVNPKLYYDETVWNEGFENLVLKYKLMNKQDLVIQENNRVRKITIPLITKDENNKI